MSSRILSSLENTFGGIPSEVCNQIKYFTYDEDRESFICILCDKTIHKTAPLTLEIHMRSVYHKRASCSEEEVHQALKKTFQNKIPQIVRNNFDLLDVVQEGFECVICDKIIKVSKNPNVSMNNFLYHLTSLDHEEKFVEYDTRLEHLKDIYGEIPQVVENNEEFIDLDRSGKNYYCTICNVLLKVDKNNMGQTKNAFEKHFYSSEHVWGAKCSKVMSLIPELQQSNLAVHTYLIRNIDYISTNVIDFFCSLCHENIRRNHSDISETMENLKHHLLSPGHEENLFGRQNHENEVFDNVNKVIGIFTGRVLKNLRYLELIGNSFSCSICNERIYTESHWDESNDNISLHFESDFHKRNLSEELQRRKNLKKKFENKFSKMPLAIKDNRAYLEFVGGNRFQCTLCDVTLSRCQGKNNLENHLKSNEHASAKADEERISESLDNELEALLGQDFEDKLPECIQNSNWSLLEFEEDSGNFHCTLCNGTILVDKGSKKEEITMQNFKNHLFSAEHTSKLKQKAREELETSERLELLFGGVPKSILSNMQFLYEKNENSFTCDACDVEIQLGSYPQTTKQNFIQHLKCSYHVSNVEDIETSIDNAFKFLDKKFGIPESLLRNADFWDNSSTDRNVYCTLCQEDLFVDLKNLKQTRRSLECHIDSERHKNNLDSF